MHNVDVENDTIELEDQEELELTPHPHQMGTDTEVRVIKEQSGVFEPLRRGSRGQLVLAPDFRHKDVWDRKRQSEPIESILTGIPILLIYPFGDENGTRQIIDGKQRISALKCFINNDSALTGLSMLPKLRGMKFSEIPPLPQAKPEDCQLHSYVIQPSTPEYVGSNIFERVSRNGMNLNKQEMRHVSYQGKATRLIRKLAGSTIFKKSISGGVKANRMRDRYLILCLVVLYLSTGGNLPDIELRPDIDAFLASVMKFINMKAGNGVINNAEKVCLREMRNVFQAVGPEALRFTSKTGVKRRLINMGLFEVLIMVLSQVKLDLLPENTDLYDSIEQYKKNFDDIGIFPGAIDTTEYVSMRSDFAQEMIKRIRNAYAN